MNFNDSVSCLLKQVRNQEQNTQDFNKFQEASLQMGGKPINLKNREELSCIPEQVLKIFPTYLAPLASKLEELIRSMMNTDQRLLSSLTLCTGESQKENKSSFTISISTNDKDLKIDFPFLVSGKELLIQKTIVFSQKVHTPRKRSAVVFKPSTNGHVVEEKTSTDQDNKAFEELKRLFANKQKGYFTENDFERSQQLVKECFVLQHMKASIEFINTVLGTTECLVDKTPIELNRFYEPSEHQHLMEHFETYTTLFCEEPTIDNAKRMIQVLKKIYFTTLEGLFYKLNNKPKEWSYDNFTQFFTLLSKHFGMSVLDIPSKIPEEFNLKKGRSFFERYIHYIGTLRMNNYESILVTTKDLEKLQEALSSRHPENLQEVVKKLSLFTRISINVNKTLSLGFGYVSDKNNDIQQLLEKKDKEVIKTLFDCAGIMMGPAVKPVDDFKMFNEKEVVSEIVDFFKSLSPTPQQSATIRGYLEALQRE